MTQINENAKVILKTIGSFPNGISLDSLVQKVNLSRPSIYSNIGKLLKAQQIMKKERDGQKFYTSLLPFSVLNMGATENVEVQEKRVIGYWMICERDGQTLFIDGINKTKMTARLSPKRRWTWKKHRTAIENSEVLSKIYPDAKLIRVFSDNSFEKI